MKKIGTLFLGIALSSNFISAQDTLYVYKSGAVIAKHAIADVDSMTFYQERIQIPIKPDFSKSLETVYAYIPDEFNQRFVSEPTAGPWTAGCDEAEYVWGFVGSQTINNNSLQASSSITRKFWTGWYDGIRSATNIINQCQANDDITLEQANQWKSEARALRAIYYYYLFRAYGPIPILGDATTIVENQFQRNTVDECVDYIVSELGKAQNEGLLEHISTPINYGRIDQTVAQAFKVEALMLKASPLFNGSNDYYRNLTNSNGTFLFPQNLTDTQKIARWKEASVAAGEFLTKYEGKYYNLEKVFTADGKLDPYLSYRKALRGANSELANYKEIIFFRQKDVSTSTMQYERTPYHKGGPNQGYRASGGLAATQEMVDSYFMANGKLPILGYDADGKTPIINVQSGYVEEGMNTVSAYIDPVSGVEFAPINTYNMYCNREPRFYANITFNGQKWLNTQSGAFYTSFEYRGNSGRLVGINDHSKTGYVIRKCAPEGSWSVNDRVCILMRLPQLYLNYIEALNEFQPGHADILKYLNLIRERAGIPQYGAGVNALAIPASQNEMREAIRAERCVELMFENTRYFDVRRWNIAKQTQNKPINGMNILGDGAAFYKRTKVEDRVFEDRQTFFPIPQSEIDVYTKLVQNPGY